MAWTQFPLTTGNDVTAVAVAQEIVAAINERATVMGAATLSTPNVGDVWFSASNIAAVQAKIEEIVPHFVDYRDNGGDWDGAISDAAVGPLLNWGSGDSHDVTNVSHASLPGGDWTREYGPDGSLTAYGNAQAGDILAGSYLNQMRLVLNELRWCRNQGTIGVVNYARLSAQAFGNSYDEAWTNLEAIWPVVWNSESSSSIIGRWASNHPSATNPPYLARGSNYRCMWEMTSLPTTSHSSIDIYAYSPSVFIPMTEWDSDAYTLLENVFNLVKSDSESGSASRTTTYFGDDSGLQTRPLSEPGRRGWTISAMGGFVSVPVVRIHKYDGPSGFTKIT